MGSNCFGGAPTLERYRDLSLPTPEWTGKSGLGDYGDFVVQTDAVVGDVFTAIDRAARQIFLGWDMTFDSESTILICRIQYIR